jgi:hypothetical protein
VAVPAVVVESGDTLVEVGRVVSLVITGSRVPLVVVGNKLLRLLVTPPVDNVEENTGAKVDWETESVVVGVADIVTIGIIAIDEAVEDSTIADVVTGAEVL